MESYEKKYKEALGWMQSLYNGLHGKTKEEAERYFPELQESEDERIRKELVFYLGDMPEDTELRNGVTNRDVLVWLEKQSEQKLAWSEEDDMMIEETLYFLREYQQSDRCKDENGMQNSVSCEKWLKSLKERIGG